MMFGVDENGHQDTTMGADRAESYPPPIVIQPEECNELAVEPEQVRGEHSHVRPWIGAEGCGNIIPVRMDQHVEERVQHMKVEDVMHDEIWPSQVPAASHALSCSPDNAEPCSPPIVSQRGLCTDVVLGSVDVESSSLAQSTPCGASPVISWTITDGKLVRTDQVDEGSVELQDVMKDEPIPPNQVPNALYTETCSPNNGDTFNNLVPAFGSCDVRRSPLSGNDSSDVCNTNLDISAGQTVKLDTMTGEATASCDELVPTTEGATRSIDDVSDDSIQPSAISNNSEANKEKFFQCTLCDADFFLRASLDHHYLSKHAQQRHLHTICPPSYLRNERLQAWLRKAHGACKCKTCGETFEHRSQLERHRLDIHRKKYVCSQCSESLSSHAQLRRHMEIHTGDKPYACQVCSAAFAFSYQLPQHMASVHGKRFACSVCPAILMSPGGLRGHMLRHSGEKPYVCKYCSETFPSRYRLNIHRASHTGKSYKCSECSVQYPTPALLRIHMKTHAKERPFKCELCDASFKSKSTCGMHMARHGEKRPFRCEVCPKGFINHCLLRNHMKTHAAEKPFVCKVCSAGFLARVTLARHEKDHQGDTPFLCKKCPARFATQLSLLWHLRSHGDRKPRGDDVRRCPSAPLPASMSPTVRIRRLDTTVGFETHIEKRGKKKRRLRKEKRDSTSRGTSDVTAGTSTEEDSSKLVETERCEEGSVSRVPEKMKAEQCPRQVLTASLTQSCNPESHSDEESSAEATEDLPRASLSSNSAPDVCSETPVFIVDQSLKLETANDEVALPCDDVSADSVHPSTANHDNEVDTKESHKGVRCKSKYFCNLCSARFRYKVRLDKHICTKHPEAKPFQCKVCSETFAQYHDLATHRVVHTGRKFVCSACASWFVYPHLLRSHMITCASMTENKKKQRFKCSLCEADFPTRSRLEFHVENVFHKRRARSLKSVSDERSVKSATCASEEHSPKKKKKKKKKKTNISSVKKTIKCAECSESFNQHSQLADHILHAHNKKSHVCSVCSASFWFATTLQTHIKTHHLNASMICQYCDEIFTSHYQLRIHVASHTGEKYVCSECSVLFPSASSLRIHVRSSH